MFFSHSNFYKIKLTKSESHTQFLTTNRTLYGVTIYILQHKELSNTVPTQFFSPQHQINRYASNPKHQSNQTLQFFSSSSNSNFKTNLTIPKCIFIKFYFFLYMTVLRHDTFLPCYQINTYISTKNTNIIRIRSFGQI